MYYLCITVKSVCHKNTDSPTFVLRNDALIGRRPLHLAQLVLVEEERPHARLVLLAQPLQLDRLSVLQRDATGRRPPVRLCIRFNEYYVYLLIMYVL